MTLAYVLGIISVLILVSGLVIFIILLLKKVNKAISCLVFTGALVVATIIGIICAAIFAFSFDSDNANMSKEYFEKIDKENEELLEKANQNKNYDTIEESNIQESTEEDEETSKPTLKDQGKIENTDYHFIITVGKEEVKKMRMIEAAPFEGVTNSYMYCYQTKNGNYDGYSECGDGEVPVFSINIYTEEQWEKEAQSPFAGIVMGQDGGYYIVFYHPNGIYPSDVPSTEDYYNSVIQSIDFAD